MIKYIHCFVLDYYLETYWRCLHYLSTASAAPFHKYFTGTNQVLCCYWPRYSNIFCEYILPLWDLCSAILFRCSNRKWLWSCLIKYNNKSLFCTQVQQHVVTQIHLSNYNYITIVIGYVGTFNHEIGAILKVLTPIWCVILSACDIP